jgi:hypothetical protein
VRRVLQSDYRRIVNNHFASKGGRICDDDQRLLRRPAVLRENNFHVNVAAVETCILPCSGGATQQWLPAQSNLGTDAGVTAPEVWRDAERSK